MKREKYPNGYQPKIEYYQAKLSQAVDSLNIDHIKFYTTKLEWFMKKQETSSAKTEWSQFYL